jgi:lipid-A-disaccharide synthase
MCWSAIGEAQRTLPLIYLVAGETSGDALGGRLMGALRAQRPDLSFAGVGGPQMTAQGVASLFPMQDLALMGLLEVLPRLRQLRRRLHQTATDIARRQPDIVVTIDSPGFTLRLLRAIRPLGMKRVHYVAPQVWAWRERRVRHYHDLWDQLLCLLPFEPAFFARHGLSATFVGHPVLESGAGEGDAARFRTSRGIDPGARVLTLMPGSRRTEVSRLLPILEATLQRLPELTTAVPIAGPVAEAVRIATREWPRPPLLISETQDKHDAFAASTAALTKSGTSTLELAMANVPMVVTYRVNPLSAAIARRLLTVSHASLVNLLAQRDVSPELIQKACTPEQLAAAVRVLLDDPTAAAAQRAGFRDVLAMLRPDGQVPSDAAAAAVLRVLDQP